MCDTSDFKKIYTHAHRENDFFSYYYMLHVLFSVFSILQCEYGKTGFVPYDVQVYNTLIHLRFIMDYLSRISLTLYGNFYF